MRRYVIYWRTSIRYFSSCIEYHIKWPCSNICWMPTHLPLDPQSLYAIDNRWAERLDFVSTIYTQNGSYRSPHFFTKLYFCIYTHQFPTMEIGGNWANYDVKFSRSFFHKDRMGRFYPFFLLVKLYFIDLSSKRAFLRYFKAVLFKKLLR